MGIIKSKKLKRIATDAELHQHVAGALNDLHRIATEASEPKRDVVEGEVVEAEPVETDEPSSRSLRKLALVAVVGVVVALVVSEDARKLALDALFGSEEEFEYTTNATVATNGSRTA